MIQKFKALQTSELTDGKFGREVVARSIDDLPAGDVLIRVHYSSLNYKDALSATGNKGVTRQYPHTPGVDAAGIVTDSSENRFKAGDEVLVTGYDLGMNTSGGFGQYIRVPADWVVRKPETLTFKEAMIFGTAGFAAAQSVHALVVKHGLNKDAGRVLVTGATGGVGGLAAAIMAHLGYSVFGASGKSAAMDFLGPLGVKGVIGREESANPSPKPLLDKRWASVIDVVGGLVLATALRTTDYRGAVTTCGNAAGGDFQTSVYPFILRGVSLYGIDSANCPMDFRLEIWRLMASKWKFPKLGSLARECRLDDLSAEIDLILKGGQIGRVIVNMID